MGRQLDRACNCYERRAWAAAYLAISLAVQETPLDAEDLELPAMAAYVVGRDEEYLKALEPHSRFKRRRVMAGPGHYTLIWSHIDGGAISLWNFDVDKHELKEEHRTGLSQWVVPQLKRGGSARVVGLTSRTGSAEHNKALSQGRADEVVRELQTELGALPRVLSTVGLGEQTAEIIGEPDNKENSALRAVTVFYWRRANTLR